MTTLKDIQDYNENLAKLHKELLHETDGKVSFGRYKTDKIIEALTGNVCSNAVIVSAVNAQRIGDLDDRKMRWGIAFLFISRASTDGSKEEAIDAANEKSLEILFDFLNKWEYDQQNDCEVMQAFDLESASIEEIETPWIDNYYGWHLFVPYKTNIPPYDPDKWNE